MLEFSIITISTFVTMLDNIVIYISKTYKKDITKYIPIFSIGFGILLGVCGYFLKDVEMGSNIIEAIFIGISAGAGATGINQVGKQLTKDECPHTDSELITSLSNKVDSLAEIVYYQQTNEASDSDIPEDDSSVNKEES